MKKWNLWGTILLAILIPFFLCTCLAPEDFEVNANIDKTGKLKFSYQGLLVHINARKNFLEKGEIPKADEDFIKKFQESITKDQRYKKVSYLGGGKFQVAYEYEGTVKEPFHFIVEEDNFFSIVPKSGNRVEVLCYQAGAATRAKLAEAQVQVRGRFTVTTDARVLAHNAEGAPGQAEAPGVYRWEIKSLEDPAPYLLLKLEKAPEK